MKEGEEGKGREEREGKEALRIPSSDLRIKFI
mgnify:CR=1 FL=1